MIDGIPSVSVEEFGGAELLALTGNHWSNENGLHYRREVTFKADKVRQTAQTGG